MDGLGFRVLQGGIRDPALGIADRQMICNECASTKLILPPSHSLTSGCSLVVRVVMHLLVPRVAPASTLSSIAAGSFATATAPGSQSPEARFVVDKDANMVPTPCRCQQCMPQCPVAAYGLGFGVCV